MFVTTSYSYWLQRLTNSRNTSGSLNILFNTYGLIYCFNNNSVVIHITRSRERYRRCLLYLFDIVHDIMTHYTTSTTPFWMIPDGLDDDNSISINRQRVSSDPSVHLSIRPYVRRFTNVAGGSWRSRGDVTTR